MFYSLWPFGLYSSEGFFVESDLGLSLLWESWAFLRILPQSLKGRGVSFPIRRRMFMVVSPACRPLFNFYRKERTYWLHQDIHAPSLPAFRTLQVRIVERVHPVHFTPRHYKSRSERLAHIPPFL